MQIRLKLASILFLISGAISSTTLFAQDMKNRFRIQEDTINSQILGQDRVVSIRLPAHFQEGESKRYPLLLLVDGDRYFPYVSGLIDLYESRSRGKKLECVLVAVHNVDRALDFTPTSAESTKGGATRENSGGAPRFTQFLEEELFPFLGKNYPISGERLFVGHSFGGLLGAYILQRQPEMFGNYLLFDPSYWWDDQIMLKSEINTPEQKRAVFMAFSGQPENVLIDDRNIPINDVLRSRIGDAQFFLKWYAEESHGSIFTRGLPLALQWYLEEKEIKADK